MKPSSMPPRIALVHDWLSPTFGGSERVFLRLCQLYPEAPVYTLLFDEERYRKQLNPKRVHTSFLQKLPRYFFNHRKYLLPLIPRAIDSFDFNDYDIVISSSNAFAKNIKTPAHTTHICYCHTPARFAWEDTDGYLAKSGISGFKKGLAKISTQRFRNWDKQSSKGVDVWLANSSNTAQRIHRLYKQKAEVVYPPVEQIEGVSPKQSAANSGPYLTISTLTPYKRIDLAIEACQQLGRELIIVGEGPQKPALAAMAREGTTLAGWVSEEELSRLLQSARGVLWPGLDDFGMTPVVAMAHGTPVIAYGEGGVLETVIDGETGVLFKSQTTKSLEEAIKRAESITFEPIVLSQHSQRFAPAKFDAAINKAVSLAMRKKDKDKV